MVSTGISAYSQAAASGQYARASRLEGKYDNVRVFWEDQTTRMMLQPYFERVLCRRADEGRNLRLLDLGCGSGDGLETIMGIPREDPGLQEHDVRLISERQLERYAGVDINPLLLEQGRKRHRRKDNVRFLQADLCEGLPVPDEDEPYDVYFTSFGTLSHLHDDAAVRLLADVARHARDGSLVVGDWLGRYAYEWTQLWDEDLSREKWMDYRISYIYSEEERVSREIDSFDLRLMEGEEVRRIFRRVEDETNIKLLERVFFDRSLFVGRHIDTGEYNRHCVPLRARVNRLHEPLCRTDLDGLLFELHVPEGFAEPTDVLRQLHASWNALIRFTQEAIAHHDASENRSAVPPAIPGDAQGAARRSMDRVRRAIEASRWLEVDDPRSDIIEPQLGFALRDLEIGYQRGEGCGHGLVCAYEVCK